MEAKERYTEMQNRIKKQIETLEEHLAEHKRQFEKQGQTSFGFVGDLTYVFTDLHKTIKFIDTNL